jgi:hypothetical protein
MAKNTSGNGRDVAAPVSALSAIITVTGQDGSQATFSAERPSGTGAVTGTYAAARSITVASEVDIHATFYATPGATGGAGAVVATASARLPIQDDGLVASALTTVQNRVASVAVVPGQKIDVGAQKFLAYTAKDASGQVVALAPGSAFFALASGGENLEVSGEVANGKAGGTATVTATVDGVVSIAGAVTVVAPPTIALVADGRDAETVSLLQLLQSRGVTPTRFDGIPDPDTLQRFDVLMVWSSSQVGASDGPKVEAFLNAGRGVVLLGDAPLRLSGGQVSQTNGTAAIAPWFAGVTAVQRRYVSDFYVHPDSASSGTTVLPLPDDVPAGSPVYATDSVASLILYREDVRSGSADMVAVSQNGAYVSALANEASAASSGALPGRVYWQWHPYGAGGSGSNVAANADRALSLLLAGATWVSRR